MLDLTVLLFVDIGTNSAPGDVIVKTMSLFLQALTSGEPLGSLITTKGRCPLVTPVQVEVMQRIG